MRTEEPWPSGRSGGEGDELGLREAAATEGEEKMGGAYIDAAAKSWAGSNKLVHGPEATTLEAPLSNKHDSSPPPPPSSSRVLHVYH